MEDFEDFLFDAGPRQVPAKRPKLVRPKLAEVEKPVDQLVLPHHSQPSLVADDEGLLSRLVAMHSSDKAHYAHYYADIVGTGMRTKWELWWVELFAGPGRLFVADEERFVHGSPLSAMDIKYPFNGYVFADLDETCVKCLDHRVGGKPGVHVLQGDANAADLHDRIAAIVPRDALVVLYCDPEGLDLHFKTLEYFAERYQRLDLLLNFPVRGVIRALRAGYNEKAGQVLDHEQPEQLIDGVNRQWGPSVRELFARRLSAHGYKHFPSKPIKSYGKNSDQYDLMLASRDPRAEDFFKKAIAREPDGQGTFNFDSA